MSTDRKVQLPDSNIVENVKGVIYYRISTKNVDFEHCAFVKSGCQFHLEVGAIK